MRRVPAGAPIVTAWMTRVAERGAIADGATGQALMERAGAAVAREVARLAAGQPILMLAGPGNNGGDAWVAACWLAERGHDVTVAELPGKPGTLAAAMRARWAGPVAGLAQAAPRPILVDGLFGIGLARPLEAPVAAALDRLGRVARLRIAIDIASGLGSELPGAAADVTLALGALKPSHILGVGAGRSGHVLLLDIGVAVETRWRTLTRPVIGAPGAEAHKFTRGMVGVIGGAMPGAARLAARAAMRVAGYVVLAGAEGGPDALVHRDVLEVIRDDRLRALLIGPGLGRGRREWIDRTRELAVPLVLDGDALSVLGPRITDWLAARPAATVLTPHAGEFARMFGNGEGSKIDRTLAAAEASGATIIHKGADTVIATPAGEVIVAADAPSWLASAGTGDVLAGLVAGCVAAGLPVEAAVWLHGEAARIAGPALIADDLIAALPAAIAGVR